MVASATNRGGARACYDSAMQKRVGAALLLAVASCAGSTVEPERSSASSEPALEASALTALGVTEKTTGEDPRAEAVTRSVTALVGVCVRSLVAREPGTRGALQFDFRAEAPAEVRASGSLAQLPATECIRGALAKAVIPDGMKGAVSYALEFRGAATAGRADGALDLRHVLVDWSSADGVAPSAASNEVQALQKQLEFCAFGAEPRLTESYFAIVRVGAGFSSVALRPSAVETAASDCMTRALRATKFTHLGTDYAIGLVATPARSGGSAPAADAPDDAPLSGEARRATEAIPARRPVLLDPPPPVGPKPIDPKGPQVKLGPASNLSPATAEIVQRAVASRRESLRACYRRGLEEDPRLSGSLVAEFDVMPNGTLQNFKVGSALGTQTSVCIGNVLANMTVDARAGAPFAVRYPLEFFVGKAPPEELPVSVDTIQKKPIADVTLADLQAQLGSRDLEFIRIPGAGEPGVVLRAGENVLAAFFASAGVAKDPETCQSSTSGRVIVVRGRACKSVLSRLLD